MYVMNRRQMLTLTLTAAAGVVVAGCSSSSDPTDSDVAVSAEPGAFPVTIDHVHGATTIEQAPKRIAVVGIGDADVLLSLGVIPVLVPVWTGSTDDGIGRWAEPRVAGADPEALENATSDFSISAVAAAQPDLIVAVNNAIDASTYGQLSGIAPTVLHAAGQTDWVLPWQDVTNRIGAAVGLPEAAAQAVEDTENLIVERREQNPQFVGRTATVVARWADGNLRAYSPSSARAQLLTGLGFVPPVGIADKFGDKLYVDISAENVSLLECDLLLFDNWERARVQMEASPLFMGLDVVRSGGLVKLDPIVSDAVSMPNPLTIPFVLDAFVDQINEAPIWT
ncbi:ABC transporter substrate-binding protein [Microbispora sp. NRRL B-24597]|uniref:ABC transporter substrate-binding protein n=2 Tax=Actinomycetes TaxID=1760 RepID=UPI0004BF41DF|nr:ABC transporter substrate-binding protein [Microbispora sp. NRRL B-24597]